MFIATSLNSPFPLSADKSNNAEEAIAAVELSLTDLFGSSKSQYGTKSSGRFFMKYSARFFAIFKNSLSFVYSYAKVNP